MRETIENLLALQELDIVLNESEILHRKTTHEGIADVRSNINDLRAQIPEAILKRYDQLRGSDIAVVKEKDGVCGGCRLSVPKGDLNRMHRGAAPWVCPNCGKFLLLQPRA
jgi:predicted  nucleic acid-binding Zn-ribbon protein